MRPPRQRRERPPRSQPPAEEGAAGASAGVSASASAGAAEGQTRAPRPPRERRERAPRPPREETADQSSGLQVLDECYIIMSPQTRLQIWTRSRCHPP